ncbi:histidine phosphatase superfamily [Leptodontidium sp. 2 PMI_412]|nr:histidine phosphatase superfamily [Leptodontidium sp. 2 PMI_412]
MPRFGWRRIVGMFREGGWCFFRCGVDGRGGNIGCFDVDMIAFWSTLRSTRLRIDKFQLAGPEYEDKDPESSLVDIRKRIAACESTYVPLEHYEEQYNMPYIKMINISRKIIHFHLEGFLTNSIVSYLHTFNLSPKQIWITRHGESYDNGMNYATALYNFTNKKRAEWETERVHRFSAMNAMDALRPGDPSPPSPPSHPELIMDLDSKNFCVWTSMLKRTIENAVEFEEDNDYDVKNWEMLNELNAGSFGGMTYAEIGQHYAMEYAKRKADKLHHIYPGLGGEGYLQVISRLREIIREMERIKDHILIISHRSVSRVLMTYFMDLTQDDIADLDVPLSIDFHAYRYNEMTLWFDELVAYRPQKNTEIDK